MSQNKESTPDTKLSSEELIAQTLAFMERVDREHREFYNLPPLQTQEQVSIPGNKKEVIFLRKTK